MAKNDEGEFELILGNRQLVSVFLIVVILLGAFFSMGYLVGRSSSSAVVSAENTHTDTTKPIVVDSATRNSPASTPTPVETPAAAPAKPSPSPVPNKPIEVPREAPPKTQQPPEPISKPFTEEPRAGQAFLQVVATTRPDAEIVAESLAKKGFRTSVVPGPSAIIFRVLVGPVGNPADLAETRVKLESAGFKPYVRRY